MNVLLGFLNLERDLENSLRDCQNCELGWGSAVRDFQNVVCDLLYVQVNMALG